MHAMSGVTLAIAISFFVRTAKSHQQPIPEVGPALGSNCGGVINILILLVCFAFITVI